MKPKGYWCLVLHAHLPFVRHPEYNDFLEEDWFFEGVVETYIPLLSMYEKLIDEGIDFRVTMSITPPLANMMCDELLQKRCLRYINKLVDLTEKEIWRTRYLPEFHETAKMYEKKLKEARRVFEKHNCNLINGFRNIQDAGKLEIVTCCATHGFLPLKIHEKATRAQIRIARKDYEEKFGRSPRGIWLAECAYTPGIDQILKEENISYFFLEAHGILYGTPRPKYGVFAPVYCPSGVAAFGRDMETAHQVWSADIGYPGDPNYREFYRDVGYDLDYDYVKPYLHEDGVRRNTGIKYYRITGKVGLNAKQPYNPAWALNKSAEQAGNFMFNREQQVKHLNEYMGKEPLVTSMYDAELYGHWWYEGPDFLNYLFRKTHFDQNVYKPITPSEYLEMFPKNQVLTPAASSWGDKGYYEVWLNSTNDWIYKHLHKAAERMIDVAERYKNTSDQLKIRTLNQLARELLLAQSSDWAFIMTTGTMVEYAQKRTKDHIVRFNTLYDQLNNNTINEGFLGEIEWKDNIFPNIDFKAYTF
ncbi:MAG: glycoside hydrolase [Elusimicrobia bacterium RIFOXYA2_FULL_39_19]|nr:MAG: glycoside hydrolase [Elusimicrobia bacterium RIFOXYA2_FULL_39_19]